jgi:hypothetical protein
MLFVENVEKKVFDFFKVKNKILKKPSVIIKILLYRIDRAKK